MKSASFPNNPDGSNRPKNRKSSGSRRDDPFARPAHPLGFQFLSEERPIRASKFGAILPSVMAKYGLGRKLAVERINAAWRESLRVVLTGAFDSDFSVDLDDENLPSDDKLATFERNARPVSLRGGALRVEVVSSILCQELRFHLEPILRELRRRLPEEKIEKIKLIAK
ncbi:MAG: DUF721 domain-containing protein [Thermoguttaceae bacterium]|nr:DUF721 domain-containing protein [Thermoguttaceae bacterium]